MQIRADCKQIELIDWHKNIPAQAPLGIVAGAEVVTG